MTELSKSQKNKHHRVAQREVIKRLCREIKIEKTTVNILIEALNKQNIYPEFACSCYQQCNCLRKSLKLI